MSPDDGCFTQLSSGNPLTVLLRKRAVVIPWSRVRLLLPPRTRRKPKNWRIRQIDMANAIGVRELARRTRIAETTLYRWAEDGIVPPLPRRNGVIMWLAAEVDPWVKIIETVVASHAGQPGRRLKRLVG